MDVSIRHCAFGGFSTATNRHDLNKIPISPPLQFQRSPAKLIRLSELKNKRKQSDLLDAFKSSTNLLTKKKTGENLNFSLDEAYSEMLELCASGGALSELQQIHGHMITSNAVSDSVLLVNKLVLLYGKCGSLLSAEKLFDRMPHRTVFAWNTMMGAYVNGGKNIEAVGLYNRMRALGIPPDAYTFPCVLKACVGVKDRWRGAEIHGLVIKLGYDSVTFITNSLVSMYARCNDLDLARQLFKSITQKEDVVLWSSIISAYATNGLSIEALRLFREMQNLGVATNSYTYVSSLRACENSSFNELGRAIHAAALKSRHCVDVYVGGALIAMYVRCGKMDDAAIVFHQMDDKNTITWNSMLSGFVQNGLYNETLRFFRYMQDVGWKPDEVSLLGVVASCGRLGNMLNGMECHAYSIKNKFHSILQVGNSLIDMYWKCCSLEYMQHTFDMMTNKDVIAWTMVITGYAQNNCPSKAMELFREVKMQGIDADATMIGSILMTCCDSKYAKEIHGYILRRGLFDIVLQNAIVDVYGKCGRLDYSGRMFKSIEQKDVVSWTSMVSSYVNNGYETEALNLFYLMMKANVEADFVTLMSILPTVASMSALRRGKEIHAFLIRKDFIKEESVGVSLVDMYSCCGTLDDSIKVFNSIKRKTLILWTSMINAYGMHGHGKKALDLFHMMENEKIVLDHIAFIALLHACSHSGLINEGRELFDAMRSNYRLDPWPDHYACLVDLLGRANHLEEAYSFVTTMPVEPTAEVWCALLRACQVHSNEELGEIAARNLLNTNSRNPGNYVLVSNTFAATRRWRDAEEVRVKMREDFLKKSPGCSWIEVGNKFHTFMARDSSHPESISIYTKLTQITEELEKEVGICGSNQICLP